MKLDGSAQASTLIRGFEMENREDTLQERIRAATREVVQELGLSETKDY